jgi:hypothetical protein
MAQLRLVCVLVLCAVAGGCAGYSAHTRDARDALDRGRPRESLRVFNELLDVDSEKELPSDLTGEKVLYVLERAVVEQALGEYEYSSRDLEVSDKQIQVLDFSHGTIDDISKFMFSDASGPYQAPPYEKLLINTLNIVNYLVRGDLNGARVEARRLSVMQQFVNERDPKQAPVGAPGSYLAGFTFEKSREPGEALRYYDEALQFQSYRSLVEPVARLSKLDGYRTEHIKQLLAAEKSAPPADENSADVLVVVGYGRVPAKIAQRIPIGLALTLASDDLSPTNRAQANRLAAQGLVTWINFPTLPRPKPVWQVPTFTIDRQAFGLEGLLAVDNEAVKAWRASKGKMIASAITRVITRVVAGEVARRATGGGTLGLLASLGTQITMTATDTPDTRSWSTLPARIAIGRARVPAGTHTIDVAVSGRHRTQTLNLKPGGWAVLNLTVLR